MGSFPSQAAVDAILYLSKIEDGTPLPDISLSEDEIYFVWYVDKKMMAVVSFEGDGLVGCAINKNGKFVASEDSDEIKDAPHRELVEFLEGLK